jgi:hypothetical protein
VSVIDWTAAVIVCRWPSAAAVRIGSEVAKSSTSRPVPSLAGQRPVSHCFKAKQEHD